MRQEKGGRRLSGVNCRGQESGGRFRSQESIARMYQDTGVWRNSKETRVRLKVTSLEAGHRRQDIIRTE
jgi:hypothetical protein